MQIPVDFPRLPFSLLWARLPISGDCDDGYIIVMMMMRSMMMIMVTVMIMMMVMVVMMMIVQPFHPEDEVKVLLCILTLENWISMMILLCLLVFLFVCLLCIDCNFQRQKCAAPPTHPTPVVNFHKIPFLTG